MTNITGQCLCGAVKYESTQAPVGARMCWCATCQKLAAGNATVNVLFKTETFKIEGGLSDYVSVADSGNRMHRRFCTKCGTPMFSEAEVRPSIIIVRAGTLDDPSIGAPQGIIWAASAPGWACLDPDLPQIPGQPAPVT